MGIIFEIIFGILGEILLQSVVQILFELGFYSLVDTLKRKKDRNPIITGLGYSVWGGILGGLSLLVLPESLITKPEYRMLNLLFVPVAAGYAMAKLGAWRRKKGQDLLRLDTFSYGTLFAFATALVRFIWAA
ncbi:hypothetical protein [uncultured Desulfosarcina sp.]|uniref:hypothetical protein n=1 Tax=uncultured Desulfosarcina sp. TaxID=218289 RepID=UPI0029C99B8C|nr:hypothetical protein [uncultured Desulfosarcina sp.]